MRTARPSGGGSDEPGAPRPGTPDHASPETSPRRRFSWDGESVVSVSAVAPQARNPERVNVHVGGAYAFSLSALLAHELGVRAGATLDPDALRDAFRRDEVGKAVEAGVRLLGFRPRSEAELSRRLGEKGYALEIAAEALDRLRGLGYVDDEEFARFWVSNRERFKPMGARRVRAELLQKGVARETADEAIDEGLPDDEYATALAAARAKLRLYRDADYPAFRRKLGGYLARQGFGFDTAGKVIRELWREREGGAEGMADGEA